MLSRQPNGNTWKPEEMRPIVAYAQREISPTALECVATVCLHSLAMLCEALCIAMQKHQRVAPSQVKFVSCPTVLKNLEARPADHADKLQ